MKREREREREREQERLRARRCTVVRAGKMQGVGE
jgi:hypothetical protein